MADSNTKRGENELAPTLKRERDYLKVQVLSDYYLASSNLGTGLITSFFVGFIVVWLTLDIQNAITYAVYILGLIVVVVFVGGVIYFAGRKYRNDLAHLSQLIEDVNKGIALPPLEEIRRHLSTEKSQMRNPKEST